MLITNPAAILKTGSDSEGVLRYGPLWGRRSGGITVLSIIDGGRARLAGRSS